MFQTNIRSKISQLPPCGAWGVFQKEGHTVVFPLPQHKQRQVPARRVANAAAKHVFQISPLDVLVKSRVHFGNIPFPRLFFFFFFCTKLKFHTISLRGEQKWRKNAGKAWPLSFKAKLWCPHRCRCTPIRERQHFCQKSSHRACLTHREGVGLERAFPSPVWAGGTAGPGAYYRFPSRWVRRPQWAGCWQQCSLHSAAYSFWNELQMVKTSYEKHLTGRGARCTKATPAALQRCTAAEGNALTWSHRHLRILPSA